jgi:hypothetical protein
MQLTLDTKSLDDYKRFKQIKRLPAWSMRGRVASFPDEYAGRLGLTPVFDKSLYQPESFMYDYAADITRIAIERRKFAVFADCGLGKTNIILSYARHVREVLGPERRVLILTPPMVVPQMAAEARKFWGDSLPVEIVKAANLQEWLYGRSEDFAVGITNYEALKVDTQPGRLAALICDESSILKSGYGVYAQVVLRLGQGLDWKLCCTGTPAPNDRVEYANHAVFLDRHPTVNSFLAKYFVNRGKTGERWEVKPHAIGPFYRALSDWCIFLSNPATYGWKDNCGTIPPINVTIHEVPMTDDQKRWVQREVGMLIAINPGGITKRSAFSQIAKGFYKGEQFATHKYDYCRDLVDSWKATESTLAWCLFDEEQDRLTAALGDSCESMYGSTTMPRRIGMIERFKSGETRTLTSKSKILGFGVNLQVATRQVHSGVNDSYEEYYQRIKRSNRIGSTKPLGVHIPICEIEEPMVENVLKKARRVEADTREQEQIFAEARNG